MLVRCWACSRTQLVESGEEPGRCVACTAPLPLLALPLDRRAIEVRQAAVLAVLTGDERRALVAVCDGLGIVGHWWTVKPIRRVFVSLALDHLTGAGAKLPEAADTLGLPRETARDWMAQLVREKATT